MTIANSINPKRLVGFWLVLTGVTGWLASFQLTFDKLRYLADKNDVLSCNFGVTVQCGESLNSWQASIFGFPNSLIGLTAFTVPIVLGVLIYSGVSMPNWIRLGLNLGVLLGFIWVIWFIYQSIYSIGTLCPWCMAMWLSIIPMFWIVTFDNLRSGIFGESERKKKLGLELYNWIWVIVIVMILIIAVAAQLHLDVVNNF